MIRESARRTSCANNMRQIAIALHNFEAAHQHFPNGINNSGAKSLPSASWLTAILPFAEQSTTWRQATQDYQRSPNPFSSHLGLNTIVPCFECFSDPNAGIVHFTRYEMETFIVASTNFVGVNGTNYEQEDGVFYKDSQTKISSISDGTSNTLLVGERPPSKDFWYGWWYAGRGQKGSGSPDMVLGVRELNHAAPNLEQCPVGPYRYKKGANDQCDTLHFWSYHPGGANYSFADGSVRFLAYNADDILPMLATRAGGETATTPE
ncbi:DUF1559 domain-containing protein [Mariniblastus sp.]|nr:DUF1559 domain-containing protein [Mariniblastus sp.]